MNIHVVLLAAGNSRRFGSNKLLYKLDGKELYLHLIEKLQKIKTGRRLIVSQYGEILSESKKRGFETIENRFPERGISYSVRLAVKALNKDNAFGEEDGIAFFVCDQPWLGKSTIAAFFEAFEKQKAYGIGCLSFGDRLGNPVIFRKKYEAELLSLTGDTGGKRIVKTHMEDVFCFPVENVRELSDLDRKEQRILVRGGGDLASGTIWHLWKAGYRVLVLETKRPACIRRQVAFSEAVYDGRATVEGVEAVLIPGVEDVETAWENDCIPVLADPEAKCVEAYGPHVVIDAIIAKRNMGTSRKLAPLTIALGPGFEAGKDVDVVIETMRGEMLGKIYEEGTAIPNTGIPGMVGGYAKERVIHAEADGVFHAIKQIGDSVTEGAVLAMLDDVPVRASLTGILRGQIREGYPVTKGLKIMDIDPRMKERENCFRISDKAHTIAEGVVSVVRGFLGDLEDEMVEI